jgi:hypothetical protein
MDKFFVKFEERQLEKEFGELFFGFRVRSWTFKKQKKKLSTQRELKMEIK